GRDPRRDLLGVPSLLHRAPEAGRHRWSGRALPAPRGQGPARRSDERRLKRAGSDDMSHGGGDGRAQPLTATRDAPVGGQAVLEGVMMRGVKTWAVAVRKPAPEDAGPGTLGEIAVSTFPIKRRRRRRLYRLPVIRGVVALVESLGIGLRALGISANAQLPEAEQPAAEEGAEDGSGG